MRLSGTFRSELNNIVIALAKRNQPGEEVKLCAPVKLAWVEAHCLDEQIGPFFAGEFAPCGKKAFQVECRKLHRLESAQKPRVDALFLHMGIFHVRDAPYPAYQQFGIGLYNFGAYKDFFQTEI